jgi:hypothetical protein
MQPLNENELRDLLRNWELPEAPPHIERRLFDGPPKRPRFSRLLEEHKRALIAVSMLAVLGFSAFHAWTSRQSVKAYSRQPYPRSKYYVKDARSPFTFTSLYTLTSEDLDHTIRIQAIDAADSSGRLLTTRQTFLSAADTTAETESSEVVKSPEGRVIRFYSSTWQEALHKPAFVGYGGNPRYINEHTLPENNCMSPEPSLRFLRYESIHIAGKDYRTAVVRTVLQNEDPRAFTTTTWYAMDPGLGCLELKSVAAYTSPDENKRGVTVHEPLSLTLGEPDPGLLDLEARIARTPNEVIPLDQWNSVITSTTNQSKAAVSARELPAQR